MRLILLLTIASFSSYGQTKNSELATAKYCGTFGYEESKSKASGTILIYPESDSTVLFYVDVNRGAPTYNSGSLYGRIKIVDGHGTFESMDKACLFALHVSKNEVTIATEGKSYCGFGQGVTADGVFQQTSKLIPEYFLNAEGIKYFFRETSPEKYGK